jgi:hypothetical protein
MSGRFDTFNPPQEEAELDPRSAAAVVVLACYGVLWPSAAAQLLRA